MARSDETLFRQWIMLTRIPRYPKRITASALKRILEGEGYDVEIRTIQRDLQKLSISFPLNCDSEGITNYWYWIETATVLDLPGMEPVTALAFEMAKAYLTPLLPSATFNLLEPYFQRADEILGDEAQTGLKHWKDKVRVIERGPVLQKPHIDSHVQNTIYDALLKEFPIKAAYRRRGQSEPKTYLMHPQGLVSRLGVLYLISTCWEYDDIRYFPLHRFESVEAAGDTYRRLAGFSLDNYIQTEQKFAVPMSEGNIKLEVLFDKFVAEHLYETPFSESQSITAHDDSRVLFQVETSDTLELRWWLQGFGAAVEVLSPQFLRDEFKTVASALMQRYNNE